MTGNPLWDFIAFDQMFNNKVSSSGEGGGDDDENSKRGSGEGSLIPTENIEK